MKPLYIAVLSAVALLVTGCQTTYKEKAEVKAVAAPKPSLSADATAALAKAEADVKAAKAKNALWTTANAALDQAKTAATKFDSAAVLKFSKTASEHAQLGLDQTKYPVSGL